MKNLYFTIILASIFNFAVKAQVNPDVKPAYIQEYDLTEGLLRHYDLDNNLEDLSGNDMDASVADSTFVHRNGMPETCFETIKTDEVNVPAIGNWGDHLVISFWFYGNVTDGNQVLFGSRQNGSGATLSNLGCILQTDSTLRFFIASDASDEPNMYSSTKIKSNDWNHVVCFQNREIDKAGIILNGNADTVTYTQTPRYINYAIGFGGWNTGYTANNRLTGRVDEIRIYNRELTFEEVSSLYQQEFEVNAHNDIMAEYIFMGNADDITGNGHDGTPNNAELDEDRYGNSRNAYTFDPLIPSFIDLGSNLKPAEFPIFVSSWINQDDITGNQVIFRNDEWDPTSVFSGIIVQTTDGKIAAGYGDSTGNTDASLYKKTTSEAVIEPNEWHHVVVGFLNNENIAIYIDNQEADGTYTGTISTLGYKSDNAALGIGSNEASAFNGRIDDCRIYNRYVDPLEIDEMYYLEDQCPSSLDTVVAIIGESDSYIVGDSAYTETGWFITVLENQYGCDSTIVLNLSVVKVDSALVAYFPFSGNTESLFDTVFNGTLQNGANFTSDRLNIDGKAVGFDGTDDYISCEPDSSIIASNSFTISAWARMEGAGGGTLSQNPIFQQRSDTETNSSAIVFCADDGNAETSFTVQGHGASPDIVKHPKPADGAWHHYVGIVNEDSVKLFIDNQLVSSSPLTTGTDFTTDINYIDIGRHSYGSNNIGFFNGNIDEVRVYSRPLDQQEIETLYYETLRAEFIANALIGFTDTPVSFTDLSFAENDITGWQWDFHNDGTTDSEEQNPDFTFDTAGYYDVKLIVTDGTHTDSVIYTDYIEVLNINEGLLRYYNLDNNLEDLSGNDMDASVADSTFVHRNGMPNSCYESDNIHEVSVPSIGNWGNHLAISFWFYGNVTDNSQVLFGSRNNGSGATKTNIFAILESDSTIRYTIASDAPDEPQLYSSTKIKSNNWNHVVFFQNRELNIIGMTLNGVTDTVAYTQTPRYLNYGFGFGGWNPGYSNNNGLKGRVDEIRIYNRELTIEEISHLYQQEFEVNAHNDIMAEYIFMGNANDMTGNGYHGTPENATLAEGHYGNSENAYAFNPLTPSFIDLGNELKPEAFPIFVSSWINHEDIAGDQVIFRNDEWDSTSVYSGIIVKTTDGKIEAAYGDSTGNTDASFYKKTTSDPVIEPNEWHHVVVGFINNENIAIYIDNQEIDGTYTGTISTIEYKSGNAAFGVGSNETSAFNGRIDDSRIYNRYLDTLEIDDIYHLEYQCPSSLDTVVASICEGELYPVGDSVYTETGWHTTVMENQYGCDSTIVLNLTVNTVYTENVTASICEGESYLVGDSVYTESGFYTNILESQYGCDSTVLLDLTVNPIYTENVTASICEGESYLVGDSVYTETGFYTTIIESQYGCDSTVILDLTVNPVYTENVSASICEGESYTVGDSEFTESGLYTIIFENQYGCDSTIMLDLTVNSSYEIDLDETLCEGESFTIGDETFDVAGEYTIPLTTVQGCDSVINLNLTVNPLPYVDLGPDTTITTEELLILDAGPGFESYLWNTDETTQTIEIGDNLEVGNYHFYVDVTNNYGCSGGDTIFVTVEVPESIQETLKTQVKIYPNPTQGRLAIEFEQTLSNAAISILNQQGQVVRYKQIIGGSTLVNEFEISDLSDGVYLIRISGDKYKFVQPVILKK